MALGGSPRRDGGGESQLAAIARDGGGAPYYAPGGSIRKAGVDFPSTNFHALPNTIPSPSLGASSTLDLKQGITELRVRWRFISVSLPDLQLVDTSARPSRSSLRPTIVHPGSGVELQVSTLSICNSSVHPLPQPDCLQPGCILLWSVVQIRERRVECSGPITKGISDIPAIDSPTPGKRNDSAE